MPFQPEDMCLNPGDSLAKKNIVCPTAQDLLEVLGPDGPLHDRGDRFDRNWIYRGQADADWPLTPSALRDPKKYLAPRKWTPMINWPGQDLTHQERAAEEWDLLWKFAEAAHRAGHELPGDSADMRDFDFPQLSPDLCVQFPPKAWRGIAALAQHSGVPTRLLDWTHSFLTACFFAAREAARHFRSPLRAAVERDTGKTIQELSAKQFSVWALSQAFVDGMLRDRHPGVLRITAPTVSNPNLRRQDGTFTLVRYRVLIDGCPDIENLDMLVSRLRKEDILEDFGLPPCHALYQFCCPWSEAGKMMQYLDGYGTNALQLFEGLEASEGYLQDKAAYIY